ncbi:MAG: GTP pyrophosphokinase family protein [Clostridia bacterium]|nr:GTP pyrophosphokinase family protein [Clostridia bacterium]
MAVRKDNLPMIPNNDDDMASSLMQLASLNDPKIWQEALKMMELMVGYKEDRMVYTCAIKEIRTKFEVLDTEFNVRYQRNPINFITTRLKSNQSIVMKMARKGIPFTIENMEKHVEDIAGIRIICSYVDDIYQLADSLLRQDDVTLLARKDYIQEPKENGYRSLHLIVSVPVFFSNVTRQVPVEVQIRTIVMDFWASLEHQMKYKQEIADEEHIIARLRQCADRIAALDDEMLEIRKQIEAGKNMPTQEELLLQKIRQLEVPIDT